MADPYFTAAELRARYPTITAPKYPDATIDDYRAIAEETIEDACGVAFVTRTTTKTVNLATRQALILDAPLQTVTAVTVDGTVWTSDQLGTLRYDETGVLAGCGFQGVVAVTYTHGYTAPPARVKQAAMILTKTLMVVGPIDERAIQVSTQDGPIALSTPGLRDAVTGVPEVDATIKQYRFLNVA